MSALLGRLGLRAPFRALPQVPIATCAQVADKLIAKGFEVILETLTILVGMIAFAAAFGLITCGLAFVWETGIAVAHFLRVKFGPADTQVMSRRVRYDLQI